MKIEGSTLAGGVEPLGDDAQPKKKPASQSGASATLTQLPFRGGSTSGRGPNSFGVAVTKNADWRVGRSADEQTAAEALVELRTQRAFPEKQGRAARKRAVAGPPIQFAGVSKLAAKPPGRSNASTAQNRGALKAAQAMAPNTRREVPDASTIGRLREFPDDKRFGEFQRLGVAILTAVVAAVYEGGMKTDQRVTLSNAVLNLMAQIPNLQADKKEGALRLIEDFVTKLPLVGEPKMDFDKEYKRLLDDINR